MDARIVELEDRLGRAMLQSDVNALDELLAPELMFTNHLGQVLSKRDDLDAHRSGMVTVDSLIPSEQRIQVMEAVAVVNVRVHLAGSYAGVRSTGDFRFTRVWAKSSAGLWQVVAGHASVIV